jgi:hypothetical protein
MQGCLQALRVCNASGGVAFTGIVPAQGNQIPTSAFILMLWNNVAYPALRVLAM